MPSRPQRTGVAPEFGALGMADCLPDSLDKLDLELELVYGHCWGRGEAATGPEFRITPGQIGRRRR